MPTYRVKWSAPKARYSSEEIVVAKNRQRAESAVIDGVNIFEKETLLAVPIFIESVTEVKIRIAHAKI